MKKSKQEEETRSLSEQLAHVQRELQQAKYATVHTLYSNSTYLI